MSADLWVAIFSGALFVATLMLWIATERSLSHARTSTERQLRAYVHPDIARMTRLEPDAPASAVVRFRNVGQTPAYDFKAWIGIAKAKWPTPFSALPGVAANGFGPARIVGPQVASDYGVISARPLTADEVKAIRAGECAIYVFGQAAYRDAFGASRFTNFCVEYTGAHGASPDGLMAPSPENNDAS